MDPSSGGQQLILAKVYKWFNGASPYSQCCGGIRKPMCVYTASLSHQFRLNNVRFPGERCNYRNGCLCVGACWHRSVLCCDARRRHLGQHETEEPKRGRSHAGWQKPWDGRRIPDTYRCVCVLLFDLATNLCLCLYIVSITTVVVTTTITTAAPTTTKLPPLPLSSILPPSLA